MSKIPRMLSAIFVLMAASCPASLPEVARQMDWGEECHGCRVSIGKHESQVFAGDPVDVDVVAQHRGSTEANLSDIKSRPYQCFEVEAVLGDHTVVPHTAYADEKEFECDGVRYGPMGPDEEIKRSVRINRMLDMSRTGKYRITVGLKFSVVEGGEKSPKTANSRSFVIEVKDN